MSELSSPLKLRAAGALRALRRSNPVALPVAIILCTTTAIAGTDTTFDSIMSILLGALEGWPGKALTLAGFAIALRGGLIQGSAASVAIGVAIALGAVYGPGILTALYSEPQASSHWLDCAGRSTNGEACHFVNWNVN